MCHKKAHKTRCVHLKNTKYKYYKNKITTAYVKLLGYNVNITFSHKVAKFKRNE